jgi:hypothetical protein
MPVCQAGVQEAAAGTASGAAGVTAAAAPEAAPVPKPCVELQLRGPLTQYEAVLPYRAGFLVLDLFDVLYTLERRHSWYMLSPQQAEILLALQDAVAAGKCEPHTQAVMNLHKVLSTIESMRAVPEKDPHLCWGEQLLQSESE